MERRFLAFLKSWMRRNSGKCKIIQVNSLILYQYNILINKALKLLAHSFILDIANLIIF